MLPKNNQPWYQNLFGTGSNVFGASNSNTDALQKAGLLTEADINKANNQSLMRGLLGTAISYISQPKNQGYGSALPYLGKAFMSGMESAQKPLDQLTNKANMTIKMADYKRQQDAQAREDAKRQFRENLFETKFDDKGVARPYIDPIKMEEMRVKYPEMYQQYLQNNKLEMEAAKLERESLGGGLNDTFSKVSQDKFTQESVAEYLATGDRRKLVPLDAHKNDLEVKKMIAQAQYEYGVDISGGASTQGQAQGSVPSQQAQKQPGDNMSTLVMPYSGDELIPEIYRTDIPTKRKHELEAQRKDERNKLRAGASSLREERKAIHKVLNAGNLHEVSGFQGQFKSFPWSPAANTEALLYNIQQKEFLNNYLQIKASGGGFGALSEKEGERLERIKINLQKEQNPKQIAELLMELDDLLAKEELSMYEDYMSVYGEYDYKPAELPGYSDSIYVKKESEDRSKGNVAGFNLRVGEIKNGYRYKGGPTSDPSSWEKVND
jgi:hypothetical protein